MTAQDFATDSVIKAPATAAASPTRSRLPSLTGLRFPAALLVFAFHSALPFPDIRLLSSDSTERRWYGLVGQAGGLGVTFFFVLSGFILTWSARAGDTTRAFWRRRFVKIVPTYFASWLLAFVLVAAPFTTVRQAVFSFFLLQSWVPDVSVFFAVNNPGWSLSTEAFFYLSFPLLYAGLRRIQARRLKWWTAAVALALVLTPLLTTMLIPHGSAMVPKPSEPLNYFWFAYIFPPPRVLDFLLGMFVARLVIEGRWYDIGIRRASALLALGYLVAGFVPVLYSLRVACVFPAALLVAAGALADVRGRPTPFAGRVAVWLGEISYAFYLIHYTVIRLVRKELGTGQFSLPATIAIWLAEIAISLFCSWLLYALVERPLTRRWSRPRRLRVAVLPQSEPAR